MVKRKKTKSKTKRISFKPGASKRKKHRKAGKHSRTLKVVLATALIVSATVCLLAVIVLGFVFLDKYVDKAVPEKTGSLELLDVPTWVNEQLKTRIYTAAMGGREDLKLNEDTARLIRDNLVREVVWLDKVRVQTTHNSIRIKARWRKPLALVRLGLQKFYVDADMVVLDYMPMPTLPIVNVKGLSIVPKFPALGKVWRQDDLAEAIALLARLDRMDKLVTPDKPLLYEIDSIDVSNFNGRQSSRDPHIVLYAKNNIKIIWGAEIGKWQQYLEATDEEKLAKLYSYYEEYGSLLNNARYIKINLRDPQETIPLPIDKY
jgi:hypothetical protein